MVVVALAQRTLGVLWFVPLAMILTPGSGHATTFQLAATLAVAGATVGLALQRVAVERPAARSGAEPRPASAGAV